MQLVRDNSRRVVEAPAGFIEDRTVASGGQGGQVPHRIIVVPNRSHRPTPLQISSIRKKSPSMNVPAYALGMLDIG